MFSLLKTDRSRTLFLKTTMLSKLLQVFFLNRCDVSGNKLVLFKCCLPQTTDDKTDKNNLKWKLTVFMSNCIASFLDELGLGITGQYQYPVYQWYQYHCSWSKWPLRQVIIFFYCPRKATCLNPVLTSLSVVKVLVLLEHIMFLYECFYKKVNI